MTPTTTPLSPASPVAPAYVPTAGAAPSPRALDPAVFAVKRVVPTVPSQTRLAVVIEMVKASPYRAVPVTDGAGRLLGLATEASLSRTLLAAQTPETRATVRAMPVADALEPLEWWALPQMTASQVSVLFDQAGRDVLPVIGMDFAYYGLVGRGDLVQELTRPFQPPQVGGMATPLGVYLTTGRVSGGVGTPGLMLTGLFMFSISLIVSLAASYFDRHSPPVHLPQSVIAVVPATVRSAVADLFLALFGSLPLLLAVRLSPLAGYHAAEHQVVHAIERGEPLLPEYVRTMPRVHPRCGTNFVAGVSLFAAFTFALPEAIPLSYRTLAGGIAALLYWRRLGSWLQQYLTTRPATDAQIESGIRAAQEVLARHGEAQVAPPSRSRLPFARIWRMGIVQVLLGFGVGIGFLALVAWLFPPLGVILNPVLHDMLSS